MSDRHDSNWPPKPESLLRWVISGTFVIVVTVATGMVRIGLEMIQGQTRIEATMSSKFQEIDRRMSRLEKALDARKESGR